MRYSYTYIYAKCYRIMVNRTPTFLFLHSVFVIRWNRQHNALIRDREKCHKQISIKTKNCRSVKAQVSHTHVAIVANVIAAICIITTILNDTLSRCNRTPFSNRNNTISNSNINKSYKFSQKCLRCTCALIELLKRKKKKNCAACRVFCFFSFILLWLACVFCFVLYSCCGQANTSQ